MLNKPDKKLNTESVALKEEQSSFLSGDNQLSDCSFLSFESKKEMINSFQKLWEKQYGESISYEDAEMNGMQLIQFIARVNPELHQLKKSSCITI